MAVTLTRSDNTAKEILKDKVNQSNIDVVLDEWNSFIHKPGKNRADTQSGSTGNGASGDSAKQDLSSLSDNKKKLDESNIQIGNAIKGYNTALSNYESSNCAGDTIIEILKEADGAQKAYEDLNTRISELSAFMSQYITDVEKTDEEAGSLLNSLEPIDFVTMTQGGAAVAGGAVAGATLANDPAQVNQTTGDPTTPTKTSEADINQAAQDVIAGKYGNGEDRKAALQAAGYDPAAVQAVVSQKMPKTPTPTAGATTPQGTAGAATAGVAGATGANTVTSPNGIQTSFNEQTGEITITSVSNGGSNKGQTVTRTYKVGEQSGEYGGGYDASNTRLYQNSEGSFVVQSGNITTVVDHSTGGVSEQYASGGVNGDPSAFAMGQLDAGTELREVHFSGPNGCGFGMQTRQPGGQWENLDGDLPAGATYTNCPGQSDLVG